MANKVLHKKSNQLDQQTGAPKAPLASDIGYGEIAINYHEGSEKIFVKNDNDEIASFATEEQIDTKLANKIEGQNIKHIISLTKEEYDALANKDSETIYIVNVFPLSFGGLQISSGPLYYNGNEYAIHEHWNNDSYKSAYGTNAGSTYFSFTNLGKLFEKEDFTSSDGNIDNLLNPLNNWRLPTKDEWQNIIINNERIGSTVNGTSGCRYSLIQLINVTHAENNTPKGLLIFPDKATITGRALNGFNSISRITTNVTNDELEVYLNQGCAFIPCSGYNGGNWRDGGSIGRYQSSTESSQYEIYLFDFNSAQITVSGGYGKSNYYSVRLVKPVEPSYKLYIGSELILPEISEIVLKEDLSTKISGDGIGNIVSLTKAEYDALANKDNETIYVVEEVSHDYVDLGLRDGSGQKILFATCNIGASSPEEYGDYFAWGETGKRYTNSAASMQNNNQVTLTGATFEWSNAPYHTGATASTNWTKYIPSDKTSYWSGGGTPDNKLVLDSSDDVAHVQWGGNWRMPTQAELQWLFNNCTWKWKSNYNSSGVNGYLVTSNENSASLFFPCAGRCDGSYRRNAGVVGNYLSSSLYTSDPQNVWYINFYGSKEYNFFEWYMAHNFFRYQGFSVRPVHVGDVVPSYKLYKGSELIIDASEKQDTLVSGTNIKTINNESILGSGNINVGLPSVSSTDNGKILKVVDGQWALVDPVTVYTGTDEPSSLLGQDGDIYLQTE